jgi:thiol-disulfide isomerase/thioredoxin
MTINRRHVLAAAMALFSGMAANAASAGEASSFSQEAFDTARKQGRPILVKVTAPWCPTCKAQKPILSGLATDPRFAKMAVFEVDFDSRKDVLKELGVQKQSTLIVYKGQTEMGRSTGETDPAAIEALLAKAI